MSVTCLLAVFLHLSVGWFLTFLPAFVDIDSRSTAFAADIIKHHITFILFLFRWSKFRGWLFFPQMVMVVDIDNALSPAFSFLLLREKVKSISRFT